MMTANNYSNKGITPAKDIEGVRRSAFWHLGRRDHSEKELRQKLARKSENQEWIDVVINECVHYGYLDDQRFTTNFIRACQNKGFAKTRIKQELKRKGISSELINTAVSDDLFNYIDSAIHLLNLKFPQNISNPHLKQKAMAFLQAKGHSFDNIFKALEVHNEMYPEKQIVSIDDAVLLLINKFKNKPLIDPKIKNKALRFLVSRGYSFPEALDAIKQYCREDRDQSTKI